MKKFARAQFARYRRARAMTASQIVSRLKEKLQRTFSYRANVLRLTYRLEKHCVRLFGDGYEERVEYGPSNLDVKLNRLELGGPFEPLDVTLVNKAAVSLIGEATHLLEVGSGTGMFARMAAADADRRITASEFDIPTLNWARTNRPSKNIEYTSRPLSDCRNREFDLVVALEVVEHIRDYPSFLWDLARVAPRAIISTPNRNRSALDSMSHAPGFEQHVREWTAGEFYWVLRVFYNDVRLYTLPDIAAQMAALAENAGYHPRMERCGIYTREGPLVAACFSPVNWLRQEGGLRTASVRGLD